MTTSTALERINEWLDAAGIGHPRCTRIIRLAVEGLKNAKEPLADGPCNCMPVCDGIVSEYAAAQGEIDDALEAIAQEIEGK